MEQTISLTTPQIEDITPSINKWNALYCLGYGATYPIALEGALKLKEVTYAHCEGMLSTEFKHGPLSAVTKDFPILFAAGPEDVPLIVSGLNEVTCRGGRAIAIGEPDERLRTNASDVITLPKSSPAVNSLLSVIPLQLLSYFMTVARGYDPDFPRNLSKTLTVD
jgi:glucosamine--fructose-6-phosphate aminotransferase (isomerizing)